MKLSACMIMKNESANIADWIDKIIDIVDECIIVDTGSTDESIEIAKSKGISVYHYQWNDDFAAAKNFALEKATGDWIVFLDADEYLDEETRENLRAYLDTVDENVDGVLCKRLNYDVTQKKRFISHDIVFRIFRNKFYLRFLGKVHENIHHIDEHELTLMDFSKKITMYHSGYSTDRVLKKLERNLVLLLREIKKNGDDGRYDYYLCDCYYGLGQYDKVIYYARRLIASDYYVIGEEERIWMLLIDSLVKLNRDENEIEAEIRLAIQAVPQAYLIQGYYGRVLTQQGRYQEALSYLVLATENLQYESKEIIRSLLCLAECLLDCDEKDMAVSKYQRALQMGCDKDTVFSAIYHAFQVLGEKFDQQFCGDVFANLPEKFYLQNKFIEFYIKNESMMHQEISEIAESLQAKFLLLEGEYILAGKQAESFLKKKLLEKEFVKSKMICGMK